MFIHSAEHEAGDHRGPAIATARCRLCSGRRCNKYMSWRPRFPRVYTRARECAHSLARARASARTRSSFTRRDRARYGGSEIEVVYRRRGASGTGGIVPTPGPFSATAEFQARRPHHRVTRASCPRRRSRHAGAGASEESARGPVTDPTRSTGSRTWSTAPRSGH